MVEFDAGDVARGDCFAIWVPWTAEQVYAVRNLWIPAEQVRQWILTHTQHEDQVKEEEKEEVEEVAEEMPSTVKEVGTDELVKMYEEKFGKRISGRFRNDSQWIINKLNS